MFYDLNQFETVDLDSPNYYITVTSNCVIFTKATVEKLGRPEFVRLLINEECKLLAVVPTVSTDLKKIDFYKDGSSSVRINNRDFARKIQSMNGLADFTIKIPGLYQEEDNAFIFDISKGMFSMEDN